MHSFYFRGNTVDEKIEVKRWNKVAIIEFTSGFDSSEPVRSITW